MRIRTALTALVSLATLTGACTVKDVEAPPLAGPSTFAQQILMSADRDTLTQNGVDFTDIRITAIGPSGQSLNMPLQAQIYVNKVAQDFGSLSTKQLVTPSTIRYTAPNASPLAGGQVPTTLEIMVTPSSNGDFNNEAVRSLSLRVVPLGVILPTNPALVAAFTVNPAAPQAFQTVNFDASTSMNGTTACATACSYAWNFGDNSTGTGITASHVYRAVNTVPVTLTITDARGAQNTTTKNLTIGNVTQPSGSFTVSPAANIATNVDVSFNASAITWTGRTITRYDWNFGDGRTGTGVTTTKRYSAAGQFTVTLTVTDDQGATGQVSQTITVTTLGGATASLVASATTVKIGQRVVFDATGSTPSAGASIVSYKWIWGDGSVEETSDNPIQSHTYTTASGASTPYAVTVVITDSNGKTASKSVSITVQ